MNEINNLIKLINIKKEFSNKFISAIDTIDTNINHVRACIYRLNKSITKKVLNVPNNIIDKIHKKYLKSYPYKIEIGIDKDIIGMFALDSDTQYPKHVIDFINSRIQCIFSDVPLKEGLHSVYEIQNNYDVYEVCIRPEIRKNFDFYVYMEKFNSSFIFCFKDKKQYTKFKLKYS
ncbi:MAG: hypothetical protein [Caudoviricetes sp.]|nr:MAG: hypothetical protein [Caudoviricetes sp.]